MKTIEVVAAIIHHDGKILATQRGYGDFKDGCRHDQARKTSHYGGLRLPQIPPHHALLSCYD